MGTPQKFFMVWLKDSPTTTKRHPDYGSAWTEANRVARMPQNIGKKVYVLEAMDYRCVEEYPLTYNVLSI